MTHETTDSSEWTDQQTIVRMIAGVVAAGVSTFIWFGVVSALGPIWWIPPLLTGALVGAAVRFAGGTPRTTPPAVIACVLTVLGCIGGYIWADSLLWEPFMLGETIKRMLGHLPGILFIALGTLVAYFLARPQPPTQ